MLFDGLLLNSPLAEFDRNLVYLLIVLGSIALGLLVGRRWGEDFSPRIISLLEERRFAAIALTAAITVGFAIRAYGIDFGLPDPYHPDELSKTKILGQMMRQLSIDPDRHLHPPLLLYLSWIAYVLIDWIGLAADSSLFRLLIAGRVVSLILGTLSIYVVYLVGERFSGSKLVGALASLLLALAPLHITCSRYMKEDVLLTFFLLLCALAAITAANTGKVRYLYLAGFLSGCCFGSKYSGLASIFIVIGAPWLTSKRIEFRPNQRMISHLAPALAMYAVGVATTMPLLFLGGNVVEQVAYGISQESKHAATGHHGVVISPWSQLWMFHISRSISPGIGAVATVLSLIAVGVGIIRRDTRLLFLAGIVALFWLPSEWAKSKPPPQFDRYILPCLPFIAILAADVLVSLRHCFQERSALLRPLSLALILIALPCVQSLSYASEIRNDTRKQMGQWLKDNLPRSTKILTSGGAVYFPREIRHYKRGSIRKIVGKDKSQIVKQLKDSGYDYLFVTRFNAGNRISVDNAEASNARIREGMKLIEAGFPVVTVFSPRFGPYGFHNPEITVYKLR